MPTKTQAPKPTAHAQCKLPDKAGIADGSEGIMGAVCKIGMTLVVLAAIGVLVAYEAPRLVKA